MQDTSPSTPSGSQPQRPPVPPPPGERTRKRSRWWIPLAVIAGLVVVVIVVIGALISALFSGLGGSDSTPAPVKANTVLVVDLSEGVVEYQPEMELNFGGEATPLSLLDLVHAIEHAATDKNIEGIFYRAGGGGGFTKMTEVRDALVAFKKSGKFIYAYIENGEKSDYYLASVADSIFMPADGLLMMNAFGTTGVFLKDMMSKLGVDFYVEQFEEYKSAGEQFSRTSWSVPAKESYRALFAHRQEMFTTAVATSRSMDGTKVLADLAKGIYIPDSLKAAGYIDGIDYEWMVRERLAHRVNPSDSSAHPKLRTRSISDYAESIVAQPDNVDDSHGFAIVYASGAIASGSSDDPFSTDGIYSKDLIKQLRKAWKNDDVEAILLRIDSPGGSALASDEIWTAIQEIRKDKPVYASMSDVAASGGYYIAMACDTIIAAPSTITGSIGVIMSIPNVSQTLSKIGVSTDTISFGPSSTFMDPMRPFQDADKAQLRTFGAGIYKRFVGKVAESRGKEFEATRALAKGRVWTGTAAKTNGLIDIEGDLGDAIAAVKRRIGVDPSKKTNVVIYPEKVDNLAALLKMFGLDSRSSNDDDDEASAARSRVTATDIVRQLVGPTTPAEIFLASLPAPARANVAYAASMLSISNTDRTLLMLPEPVPSF